MARTEDDRGLAEVSRRWGLDRTLDRVAQHLFRVTPSNAAIRTVSSCFISAFALEHAGDRRRRQTKVAGEIGLGRAGARCSA